MLQIFEIESEPGPYELRYDEEWLAITKKFNPVFPRTRMHTNFRLVNLFPHNNYTSDRFIYLFIIFYFFRMFNW